MVTSFSLQTYLSVQHIISASYFCDRAFRIEDRAKANATSDDDLRIKAYSSSAVFLSVAFLEALINEIFADAEFAGRSSRAKAFDRETLQRINRKQKEPSYLRTTDTLTKFNDFLTTSGQQSISKGCKPGQDAKILLDLRNNLIHYKGPWLDVAFGTDTRDGALRNSELGRSIKHRFPPRRCASPQSGDYWLGAGCASWSLKTAVAFSDLFFERIGIKPTYEHVRFKL